MAENYFPENIQEQYILVHAEIVIFIYLETYVISKSTHVDNLKSFFSDISHNALFFSPAFFRLLFIKWLKGKSLIKTWIKYLVSFPPKCFHIKRKSDYLLLFCFLKNNLPCFIHGKSLKVNHHQNVNVKNKKEYTFHYQTLFSLPIFEF